LLERVFGKEIAKKDWQMNGQTGIKMNV